MRGVIEFVCWLLPASRAKNLLLRRFGHDVSASARIGPVVVRGVRRFDVGDHVTIGFGNVFTDVNHVRLDDHVIIASWNSFVAAPQFRRLDPRFGTFWMQYGAAITSRHHLDATGTIVMSRHARIGGGRAHLQTHQPEFDGRDSVGHVTIGDHSLVASCAVMLMDSHLPDRSVLGANSTLGAGPADRRSGLYVGSPAQWRREMEGEYFVSTEHVMTRFTVDPGLGPL